MQCRTEGEGDDDGVLWRDAYNESNEWLSHRLFPSNTGGDLRVTAASREGWGGGSYRGFLDHLRNLWPHLMKGVITLCGGENFEDYSFLQTAAVQDQIQSSPSISLV